jgi:hypothetical protein
MYTIYNKQLKKTARIVQKGFESLNLNIDAFIAGYTEYEVKPYIVHEAT